MIIYALVSGASVGALFLGGVVPGFLMAVLMMVVVHIIATKRNMPREDQDSAARLARHSVSRRLAAVLAHRVAGRHLLGRLHAHRGGGGGRPARADPGWRRLPRLTWRSFWGVVMESTRGSAVITLILAGSFMLNYAFTAEGVPQAMALWVDGMHFSQLNFLLMVNLLFLVLGCFLDVSVLLLVFVPMLLPAARLLGIDLVHFGVLVVLNMMIGLITPPFGMLLFVTKALTGIPIGEMIQEGWLFLVMLLAPAAGHDGVPANRAVAAAKHGLRDALTTFPHPTQEDHPHAT